MTGRRRAGVLAAVAAVLAALAAGVGGVRPSDATAVLELGHRAVPYALVRPLWTDRGAAGAAGASLPVAPDRRERAQDALDIIRREQQRGAMLAGILDRCRRASSRSAICRTAGARWAPPRCWPCRSRATT